MTHTPESLAAMPDRELIGGALIGRSVAAEFTDSHYRKFRATGKIVRHQHKGGSGGWGNLNTKSKKKHYYLIEFPPTRSQSKPFQQWRTIGQFELINL